MLSLVLFLPLTDLKQPFLLSRIVPASFNYNFALAPHTFSPYNCEQHLHSPPDLASNVCLFCLRTARRSLLGYACLLSPFLMAPWNRLLLHF